MSGVFLWPWFTSTIAPQSETTKPLKPHASRRCSLQQHLVGAGGELVDGVVGAHHGLHVALGDGGAKGGQVGLFEIARAGIDVEAVAQLLRAAVHGEVLAGGDGAQMIEVVALHAADEGDAQAAGQERDLRRRSPGRGPSADRGRY